MYKNRAHFLLTNELLHRYRIDPNADSGGRPWLPVLDLQSAEHNCLPDTSQDYFFRRIDYLDGNGAVQASRMVAEVLKGKRTETAWWSEAAPEVQLTVHRGTVEVVTSDPLSATTYAVRCGDGCEPQSTGLKPGTCYTLVGIGEGVNAISGLYGPDFDWSVEQTLHAGTTEVMMAGHRRPIPPTFVNLINS